MSFRMAFSTITVFSLSLTASLCAAQAPPPPVAIPLPTSLTPKAPATPRINGPRVYGARPGSPFFYHIPATGQRPIAFTGDGLPSGLKLDKDTGNISGKTDKTGIFSVTITATNALGSASATINIVIGDQIALTPPMGWNSWNCFAGAVDQTKVLAQANAMASSGLIDHGWTYINTDDTWQGARGGKFNGIQGNEKFPDIKAMCDTIHGLGLKAGIYSTPWTTSYAGRIGGSSENPDGAWTKPVGKVARNRKILPYAVGKYSFARQDAQQWAAWGFDYLKYDWNPNEVPETKEMSDALKASGRDIVYSLSNSTPFANIADLEPLANCWRTTGDIRDTWKSMTGNGFSQAKWAPFAGPGHWNDPDMLVVGSVGWGPKLHPSRLTADEQYTHISLWCLLSSPLLIGCDLTQLDDFTLGLLTNDEVLAIDQDSLGKEAVPVKIDGTSEVWSKTLADGTTAVGLFNRGEAPANISIDWATLNLSGAQPVRDLWRQQDLGPQTSAYSALVAPHAVMLVKIGTPAKVN